MARIWLWGRRLAVTAVALCAAMIIGFAAYAVLAFPPLQPWHTEILTQEFSAERDGGLDFDGYLKLEDRMFAEMRAKTARWDRASEAYVYSRFNPASRTSLLAEGAPYNRSFRLRRPDAVGQALLIQGLTDSPYSMKALAESLHARGFEVTVLRLPGHGALPSMMTRMTVRDWTAAVRIAARDVAGRAAADQPFYIGGYSTGGTLALQYTLDALEDASLRKPDRVLLVSPALEIPRIADVANLLDMLAAVPVPQLQKARWQGLAVEYDPYKFNSFPINATRQVNRATKTLQRDLARAAKSGRIARMPPVIAWQSVVDSTVGSNGVADILFARLRGPRHQLVLFDVNRQDAFGAVQRPAARALVDRLTKGARGYTLDVVANTTANDRRVSVRRLTPDGRLTARETALEWPETLVSVGHVALPFRPDDPVYGLNPGSGRNGMASLGTWQFRGEAGAVTVNLGAFTRPRSNPFWPLIDEEVGHAVEADRAGRQKPGVRPAA
jgi:alpha-beta hydrolase superfamily lysophospholipase